MLFLFNKCTNLKVKDGGLFIVYNQLKLIVLLEIYGFIFYFS
jgi:hypothetical protein